MIAMLKTKQSTILWGRVWALAGLQGAITLAWIIYNAYLPKLLTDLGLSEALGVRLLIIENALAVVMEPLMGSLSDRYYVWVGSRFPVIGAGVVASSALFIGIPVVVIFGNPTVFFQNLLIGVIIVWSLAMTVFRSPAIALLGRCASAVELPWAASALTLVGGLIGAGRPLANSFLLSNFPPMGIFILGSILLLGTAIVLRFVQLVDSPIREPMRYQTLSLLNILVFISGLGILVAWGTRFLFDAITRVAKSQLGDANATAMLFVVGIVIAVLALPMGKLATAIGNKIALLLGLATAALGVAGLGLLQQLWPLWLLLVVPGFSLTVNSVIPHVLSLLPAYRAGLGIGSYFGGFSAAMALFTILFTGVNDLLTVGLAGAASLVAAAVCVKLVRA